MARLSSPPGTPGQRRTMTALRPPEAVIIAPRLRHADPSLRRFHSPFVVAIVSAP
jgi:hypothetical protein